MNHATVDSNDGVSFVNIDIELKDILTNDNLAVFVVNAGFNVVFGNKAWMDMFSIITTSGNVLDTWVSSLTRNSKNDVIVAWNTLTNLSRQSGGVQKQLLLDNGKTYLLSFFKAVTKNDIYIGTVVDITEFKGQLTIELQRLQTRLHDRQDKFEQQSIQIKLLEWYLKRGLLENDTPSQFRSVQLSLRGLDKILEETISNSKTGQEKLKSSLQKSIDDALRLSSDGQLVLENRNVALVVVLDYVFGKHVDTMFRDIHISESTYVMTDFYRLTQLLTLLVSLCFSLVNIETPNHDLTSIEDYTDSNLHVRLTYDGVSLSRDTMRYIASDQFESDIDVDSDSHIIVFIICKLVSTFGGKLTYTFNPTNLGVFDLNLPIREVPAPVTRQLTVLIVEDNDVVRLIEERQIRKLGHVVFSASLGKEALEMFKKHIFDIIVVDIQLPDMLGYDLIKQIRNLEATQEKQVPVSIVAISGFTGKDYQNLSLNAGADAFLTKPWRPRDLEDIIVKYSKNA